MSDDLRTPLSSEGRRDFRSSSLHFDFQMEEVPHVVRSPAQSNGLREADPAIPAPPPILDTEVLDEGVLADRVNRSEVYLDNLKSKRRLCLHEDLVEAKRYKAEVRIAAMTGPLLRLAPRAQANEVVALMMPVMQQAIQQGMQQGM